MRLYGSVVEVVTMCLVYKYGGCCAHTPPPPPAKPPKNSRIWILCQNLLTKKFKITFVGLVL